MTSGSFQTYPLDRIWIDRDKRQRRELKGIEELAESIQRIGLIHPPVIRRSGELVVGERRVTAMRQLGWTDCPIQWIDELDEQALHVVELEENLRRVNLTWQEECQAIAKYQETKAAMEPEWSAAKTAEALGLSPGTVSERLAVAKELARGHKLVVDAPKYSVAKNVVAREAERRRSSVARDLDIAVEEEPRLVVPLLNADFNEWAPAYRGEPFNFIHCDFPYGVQADKHDQGAAAQFGGYADDPDVYWKLLETLNRAMENVVAPSAHLMFWFSMDFYQETYEALTAMGWNVQPHPLVWFKSDNTGILPDPSRGPRRVYETAFFAARGDRKIVQAVANCFPAPVTKTVHMSEKSLPMLQHFFRMTCDENTRLLDPTAGSGSSLKAGLSRGSASVLGLERDGNFYARAVEAWGDDN